MESSLYIQHTVSNVVVYNNLGRLMVGCITTHVKRISQAWVDQTSHLFRVSVGVLFCIVVFIRA